MLPFTSARAVFYHPTIYSHQSTKPPHVTHLWTSSTLSSKHAAYDWQTQPWTHNPTENGRSCRTESLFWQQMPRRHPKFRKKKPGSRVRSFYYCDVSASAN